jgi:hypothetical protein
VKRSWLVTAAVILAVVAFFVIRNQIRVYRGRQVGASEALERQMVAAEERLHELKPSDAPDRGIGPVAMQPRRALMEALRPVALSNCRLERFGEAHDGGYLMCGNLLGGVESGYSYGIAGYDKWGCDISTKLSVKVHQYDCFDTTQPACPAGDTIFHAECVGDATRTVEGRFFDTIEHQLARNGDAGKRIVLKIDVEGAEWDSFIRVPDAVLSRIDQLAVEFHRVRNEDDKYLLVVERLKRFFHVAHLHFNNHSCTSDVEPLPGWAYEVLFVSKRIATVDATRTGVGLHPLDAPNDPSRADCQPVPSLSRDAFGVRF